MPTLELQKNILTTVAYYDAMDYPMTSFEVWKYLTAISNDQLSISNNNGVKGSLLDVLRELESEKLKKFIEEYRGFYFLKGRQELVEQRLKRNKIANQKLKKLLKIVSWLRFIPYVRMLAVTGSLAMKNTAAGSDLDLLVVLQHGKMFTGRFLVTALAQLLGKRRYANKIQDRICLNHFLSDRAFEVSMKDLFSSSEYVFVLPVFGWHNFQKFQNANAWLKKYKPNFQPDEIPNIKFLRETNFSQRLRSIGEKCMKFAFIERKMKQWQLQKIENNPNTKKIGGVIVATDDELSFWPNFENQGPQIFGKFKEKLEKMGQ